MNQNYLQPPNDNNLLYKYKIYDGNVFNELLKLKACQETESFIRQLSKVVSINFGSEPKLINLKNALNLNFIRIAIPIMVDEAIKMMKSQPKISLIIKPGKFEISYDHIYALLSLCFFNLLIKQGDSFPLRYNYLELFNHQQQASIQVEKLKGHLHYFLHYSQNPRPGTITIFCQAFNRIFHGRKFGETAIQKLDYEVWSNSKQDLANILLVDKPIEHIGDGVIVDFADKKFGGFSFYKNVAQEEILLLCKPESLVGVLLISELKEDDALLISGCYDYNTYKGYRKTFQVVPIKPIQKQQIILAIDAVNYSRDTKRQYSKEFINRDLNKAFIGFSQTEMHQKYPISTGKWGCGIFKGDWMLKLLQQWLAFSQSISQFTKEQRQQLKLYFSLFGEKNIQDLIVQISKKYQTVGNLYVATIQYSQSNSFKKDSILDYLIEH